MKSAKQARCDRWIRLHARYSKRISVSRLCCTLRKLWILVKVHILDHLHGQSIAAENRSLGFEGRFVIVIRRAVPAVLKSQDIWCFRKNRNFRCCLIERSRLQRENYG